MLMISGNDFIGSVDGLGSETATLSQLPCNLVNNFTADWDQCNFVIQNDCLEEEAIDYVYFVYCLMGTKFRYLSIITIVSLMLIFFLTLSTIADEFLCPSLLTIAKNLRMSENLAGITLLAFGNGSSDIFSSLAAASSGKAELIVSELLGGGIFCLSIVAGLIFIKQDFRLAYRPLLRDTIFYLFAVYFTWFVCWGEQITLYYALAFILIYVIYLTVALGGQAIFSHLQQKERQKQRSDMQQENLKNSKKELPTVSVQINKPDDKRKKPIKCDKLQVQENDWAEDSDWFVQSHDSVRRRRLSKSKLMMQEDCALLKEQTQSARELPKYGGLNQNVTQIRIDCKPSSQKSKTIGDKYDINKNEQLEQPYQLERRKSLTLRKNATTPTGSTDTTMTILDQSQEMEQNTRVSSAFIKLAFESPKKSISTSSENSTDTAIKNQKNDGFNHEQQQMILINNNNNIITKDNLNKINYTHNEYDQDRHESSNYQNQSHCKDHACLPDLMIGFPSAKQSSLSFDGSDLIDDDDNPLSFNEWDDLIAHINPIYMAEWYDSSLIRKILTIIRAPLLFVALCTVPIVDHDKKRSNWCRLLNIFHCITIPLVILISHRISMNSDSQQTGNINHNVARPMIAMTTSPNSSPDLLQDFGSFVMQYYPIALFVIGSIVALYMFKTTKSEKPPKYHVLFAYAGFLMSILWVYTLVTEILGLLKTIGIIFSMSDTTIGLAFLAWGNSLGDIVANLALAEAGYPRMAIGACLGAPLLNLLIGFGLSFAVNLNPGDVVTIEYTPTLTLLCLSLAIVIISLMLCTLVPPSYSKRPFGYILMTIYFTYFVLAIALEFELITFD